MADCQCPGLSAIVGWDVARCGPMVTSLEGTVEGEDRSCSEPERRGQGQLSTTRG
jgi:hypothetical protein